MNKRTWDKLPAEIAVCVGYLVAGDHQVVISTTGDQFLLPHDETKLPDQNAVIVLVCTNERPDWYPDYSAKQGLDAGGERFTLTGKWEDVYLWRIKK